MNTPPRHSSFAFGLTIESDWEIPCSPTPHPTFASIRLRSGTEQYFLNHVPAQLRRSDPQRIYFKDLIDGSRYVLWRDVFEFHISADSKLITGRSLDEAPEAAFKTYMLGHLLSTVLLGFGIETLHAAGVVIGGGAVGLLGDSARGKSTLAAAFLKEGHRLLSDDFLVVHETGAGPLAYPGLPRIKLYERVSRHLIRPGQQGTPMNQDHCPKMVYPVDDAFPDPISLRAFYSIASPKAAVGRSGVVIEPLTEREAYLELTGNSFNTSVKTSKRLAAQFEWATALVKAVSVKRLVYPRVLSVLPEVVAAVCEDVKAQPQARDFASTLPSLTP